MNGKRSVEAILEFQQYQADKGLLAKATAQSRKAALGKVLGILDADEAEDVTKLDLDEVMMRFSNLEGKSYKPKSLQVYKSRVLSAISDFESYLDNPLGFRPSVNQRSTKNKFKPSDNKTHGPSDQRPDQSREEARTPTNPSPSPSFDAAEILPIPIRPGLVIRVQGIPFDLQMSEAKKIANVIIAMSIQEE